MRFFPALSALLLLACPAKAGTVEDIQGRGVVTCALPTDSPGLVQKAAAGREGLAVDLCALLAAAVLGRAEATAYVDVTPEDSAVTLQAGEADVLLVPQAWTLSQEVEDGVMLVQPLLSHASDGTVFGPVVRQGDDAWFVTVRWVLLALQATDVPPEAAEKAASGLSLHPQWNSILRVFARDYAALLERHLKSLEAQGWAVVPVGPSPRW